MAEHVLIPGSHRGIYNQRSLLLLDQVAKPWWRSLASNLRDVLFPEKLPPLVLTSKPVRVRDIWGESAHNKKTFAGSLLAHAAILMAVVGLSLTGASVVQQVIKDEDPISLIAPDVGVYMPVSTKANDTIGGGGGGGDRDKIEAPKGKLPEPAMEQFTPPAMVLRNDNPKLVVKPSVVLPPEVKIATAANLPNLGDPMAKIPSGPPANGTGSGGGIGSGKGGGVGTGEGPGVGAGRGGGFGGGIFKVGGGVSAPVGLYMPDPEYTEEARKAKYQGTVVLWLIVDQSGRPRDIKVARALGMGLDQKAVEAVRQWKFDPAKKDGQPVAVMINVEVNFRLY
jgi:protein TonB